LGRVKAVDEIILSVNRMNFFAILFQVLYKTGIDFLSKIFEINFFTKFLFKFATFEMKSLGFRPFQFLNF
jgi:hypothetical protein